VLFHKDWYTLGTSVQNQQTCGHCEKDESLPKHTKLAYSPVTPNTVENNCIV